MEFDPERAADADRWQQVEDLVFLWLMAEDRSEATLRGILAPCPELEPDVRRAIAALLPMLGNPEAGAAPVPDRLGAFRLVERIGAGAMGAVYRARDEALAREVAVKIVHPELLWLPGRRERFRLEVAAVARLSHPGIVPVYTAGEDHGIPYYAMELVAGCSLAEVIARVSNRTPRALDARDLARVVRGEAAGGGSDPLAGTTTWTNVCLRLAAEAADALAHAHARGVLHRDIKPSNILVDHELRTRVVDFGLARATPDQELTKTGTQVGSLAYMAPEQVVGKTTDERSDVYSLGATLYELLTLRSPFLAPHGEETRRRILAGQCIAPRELVPELARDVAAVVTVALDRDPRRRYASMPALHADLRALLDGRPIAARPPGPVRRAQRWAAQHPIAAATMAFAAVLSVTAPSAYAIGANRHRDAAIAARDEATRLRGLDRARAYRANLAAAELALRAGNTSEARARLSDCADEERAFEWRLLAARLDPSLAVLRRHTDWVRGVAVTADGTRAFTGDFAGNVYAWDLSTREAQPLLENGPPCVALAASANGQVVATGHLDGSVRVWDPTRAALRAEFQLADWAVAIDVSANGERVIAGGRSDTSVLFDVTTATPRSFAWGKMLSLALSPDGTRVAASLPTDIAIFDLANGERVGTCAGHARPVTALAFSRDGRRLLTGSVDSTARIYDAGTGALQRIFAAQGEVMDAVFVGDDRIATASNDSTLRLWDIASGAALAVYHGHEAGLYAVAADARAQLLVSGAADHTVRLWRTSGPALTVSGNGASAYRLGWIDGERLLAVLDLGSGIQLRDPSGSAAVPAVPSELSAATSLATAGDRIAAGTENRGILVWQVGATPETAPVVCCAVEGHFSRAIAFANEHSIVSAGDHGELIVVDLTRRAVAARAVAHDGDAIAIAVAPRSGVIATGGNDGTIALHTSSLSGTPRRVVATGKFVFDLCFSPDGRLLLSAEDDAVCLRDGASGELIKTHRGHQGKARGVAFLRSSPARLVSVGMDGSLRFWSLDDHAGLVAIAAHNGPIYAVACTADGASLATGSVDGTVAVWR